MEKIGLVHWPHVSTTEQEQGRASTRIRVEETSVALARTIQIARWLGREWCETHANTAEVRTRREGREVIHRNLRQRHRARERADRPRDHRGSGAGNHQ